MIGYERDQEPSLQERIRRHVRQFDDGRGDNQPQATLLLMEVLGLMDRGSQRRASNTTEPATNTSGEVPPQATCLDCGLPYAAFPLDVNLPRAQWLAIHPEGEDGLLCAACIVARAATLPGVTVAHMVLEVAIQKKDSVREGKNDSGADALLDAKYLNPTCAQDGCQWLQKADAFLERLASDGGAIVSSAAATEIEIADARVEGRWFQIGSLGFIIRQETWRRMAEAALRAHFTQWRAGR